MTTPHAAVRPAGRRRSSRRSMRRSPPSAQRTRSRARAVSGAVAPTSPTSRTSTAAGTSFAAEVRPAVAVATRLGDVRARCPAVPDRREVPGAPGLGEGLHGGASRVAVGVRTQPQGDRDGDARGHGEDGQDHEDDHAGTAPGHGGPPCDGLEDLRAERRVAPPAPRDRRLPRAAARARTRRTGHDGSDGRRGGRSGALGRLWRCRCASSSSAEPGSSAGTSSRRCSTPGTR